MPGQSESGFTSILTPGNFRSLSVQSTDTVRDLALDRVFERIGGSTPTAAHAFGTLLTAVGDVRYRQDVFRALEEPALADAVAGFLTSMTASDRCESAASRASGPYLAELWHLNALTGYVAAVENFDEALTAALTQSPVRSTGWDGLQRHVAVYRASAVFGSLAVRAPRLREDISQARHNLLIRDGGKVAVAATDDEADLEQAVLSVFARFRHGEAADHHTVFREPAIDHVQAWILERAAQIHPGLFSSLVSLARDTGTYRDPAIARFVDEVPFYLAYLDQLAPLRRSGLVTCYPTVSTSRKDMHVTDGWDLALAARAVAQGDRVVTNDLHLTGPERILVISGPNQGGKTTTARMFGQVHYLAALGCPVPGRTAQLSLCDQVLTVFEREERLDTLEGRLGDEVDRLHAVFARATTHTVIVVNELFASTALHDARILTADVLRRICALDALSACVTFIDELSRLNEHTVSMVARVDTDDAAVRTFRVERRVADGRAYARALAARHGLTLDQIRSRLDRSGVALEEHRP
ncbi:hypothetical protein BKD30_01510 [Tersicoccus phoenicis]|uniref:DNA mismatch repair proteins mutS family domain-containing protein n=1 Tax=Tersicoccus phoenicis TaxID=554083 RepID=A0A1R1LNI6_9MICC|nr:hypothetical protein [Tersicoccus phoenicis]OMH29024.1 hypothetical protein BKD30_01510 [Tersicoccus phoenicis]